MISLTDPELNTLCWIPAKRPVPPADLENWPTLRTLLAGGLLEVGSDGRLVTRAGCSEWLELESARVESLMTCEISTYEELRASSDLVRE